MSCVILKEIITLMYIIIDFFALKYNRYNELNNTNLKYKVSIHHAILIFPVNICILELILFSLEYFKFYKKKKKENNFIYT